MISYGFLRTTRSSVGLEEVVYTCPAFPLYHQAKARFVYLGASTQWRPWYMKLLQAWSCWGPWQRKRERESSYMKVKHMLKHVKTISLFPTEVTFFASPCQPMPAQNGTLAPWHPACCWMSPGQWHCLEVKTSRTLSTHLMGHRSRWSSLIYDLYVHICSHMGSHMFTYVHETWLMQLFVLCSWNMFPAELKRSLMCAKKCWSKGMDLKRIFAPLRFISFVCLNSYP